MTGRLATMSMDGTPISQADIARMEEEERHLAERQRQAARVIAASAQDVHDARLLLDILGLDHDVISAARCELRERPARNTPGRRRSRAA
jgi:hypothetical protein